MANVPPGSELIVKDRKTVLSVIFDVIRIEIHCGDDYEAQVLFDDLCDRCRRGEKIVIDNSKE